MTDFQSDKALIGKLRAAAGKKMTAEEVRAQRVSFVMSAVDKDDSVTRADVERVISEREGAAA